MNKNNFKGNVPLLLTFDDYHEINYFKNYLQQIFPQLDVIEITDEEDNYDPYTALVYKKGSSIKNNLLLLKK